MYSDADDLPERESGASDGENDVVCTHCNVSAHLHITHITLRLSLKHRLTRRMYVPLASMSPLPALECALTIYVDM